MTPPGPDGGPGPLRDEAVRLAEALAAWLPDAAARASELASPLLGARAAGRDTSDHDTGHAGPDECRLCPVCQLLAVARGARPETMGHLLDAAGSLLAAVRTLVDAGRPGAAPAADRPVVQRIDVS